MHSSLPGWVELFRGKITPTIRKNPAINVKVWAVCQSTCVSGGPTNSLDINKDINYAGWFRFGTIKYLRLEVNRTICIVNVQQEAKLSLYAEFHCTNSS